MAVRPSESTALYAIEPVARLFVTRVPHIRRPSGSPLRNSLFVALAHVPLAARRPPGAENAKKRTAETASAVANIRTCQHRPTSRRDQNQGCSDLARLWQSSTDRSRSEPEVCRRRVLLECGGPTSSRERTWLMEFCDVITRPRPLRSTRSAFDNFQRRADGRFVDVPNRCAKGEHDDLTPRALRARIGSNSSGRRSDRQTSFTDRQVGP